MIEKGDRTVKKVVMQQHSEKAGILEKYRLLSGWHFTNSALKTLHYKPAASHGTSLLINQCHHICSADAILEVSKD